MTRHDDTTRLRHMLDHALEAVDMARGQEPEELKKNRMLQLALVHLVEIIGEAAARVSPEGQNQNPSIPWRQAKGMRNRLIHGYDTIDLDILWDTIQEDLPPLIEQLRQALEETQCDH
jgi:uncharacterized protein with HEPN domain